MQCKLDPELFILDKQKGSDAWMARADHYALLKGSMHAIRKRWYRGMARPIDGMDMLACLDGCRLAVEVGKSVMTYEREFETRP